MTFIEASKSAAHDRGTSAARSDYEQGTIVWQLDGFDRDRSAAEVWFRDFNEGYAKEARRILRQISEVSR
jgi:hypothetical protein